MDYRCLSVGVVPGVSAGDIVCDDDPRVAQALRQYPYEFETLGTGVELEAPQIETPAKKHHTHARDGHATTTKKDGDD